VAKRIARMGAMASVTVPAPQPERTAEIVAREIAEKIDCDIFLYNGPISEEMYGKVVESIVRKKRNDILVILVTLGGEANPAYRIARLFQQTSGKFTLLIPSYCKSAGTLLALGANELMMAVFAELGPLDVQLVKYDELGERRSGLTTHSALDSIKAQAFEMFGDTMMEIKRRSRFRVRFRTAADLATHLTVGLFSNIYSQLDPLSMGEDYRDLHVALDYGSRLADHSKNAYISTVWSLVHEYPSHDFVIDYDEAKDLFRSVTRPNPDIYELLQLIGDDGMKPLTSDDGIFKFLSEEPEPSATATVDDEADGDRHDAPQPDADAEVKVVKL
jgi:hypothetical protein